MKPQLKDNDTEIFSTQNERKSVIAKRFIRAWKKIIHIWLQYQKMYLLVN